MTVDVFAVPAFTDNYIWVLARGRRAIVVDPGDAAPVEAALAARGLALAAILVTHHHGDHVGGLARLLSLREVPVYGPAAEAATVRQLTHSLRDGDRIDVEGLDFSVLEVPGHTRGHIAFHGAGLLLCGDTLFSAGCGRLFEGTAAQLHASLQRLAALPGATAVHCTHEYTLANLAFASAVEPANPALQAHRDWALAERAAGRPTLPSSIAVELRINPFLRTHEPAVREAASRWAGEPLEAGLPTFTALRRWKDVFRA